MISYIMIGANDVDLSGRMYSAILLPIGYVKTESKGAIIYALPDIPDRHNGPAVYITKPYDGREATVGNGSMTAFRVDSHALVRELHAAGVAAGGKDEGAPGFRAEYSERFFVGYLRDPVGNKVALFCTNPSEPTRNTERDAGTTV